MKTQLIEKDDHESSEEDEKDNEGDETSDDEIYTYLVPFLGVKLF